MKMNTEKRQMTRKRQKMIIIRNIFFGFQFDVGSHGAFPQLKSLQRWWIPLTVEGLKNENKF